MMLDFAGHPAWRPPIVKTSAPSAAGVPEAVEALEAHGAFLQESGEGARAARACGPARACSPCSRSASAGRSRRGRPSPTGSRRPCARSSRGGRTRTRRPDGSSRRSSASARGGREGAGMTAYKIDHLGIAVASIDDALAVYRALGIVERSARKCPTQKVVAAFLPVGESRIELLEPTVARTRPSRSSWPSAARESTTSASPCPTSTRRSRTSSAQGLPAHPLEPASRAPAASASRSSIRRPATAS